MEKRTRAYESTLEVRGEKDKKMRVGGLLVPWGRETVLDKRGGVEVVEQFAADSIRPGDHGMFYLLNHDTSRSVASSAAGTMTIDNREDGLYVTANLDMDDPDAQRVYAKARNGSYGGQSIGFRPIKESREEERDEDDNLVRVRYVIREAEMLEASAVAWPAYRDTTLGVRRRAEVDKLISERRGLSPQHLARIERERLALTLGR